MKKTFVLLLIASLALSLLSVPAMAKNDACVPTTRQQRADVVADAISDGIRTVVDGVTSRMRQILSSDITIKAIPANTVKPGKKVTLKAKTAFPGRYTYQWYSSSKNSDIGGNAIEGATRNTYKPDTTIPGIDYYYCVVNEIAASDPIEISVGQQVQPVSNVRLEMGANGALYVKYDKPSNAEGILQYRIRLTGEDGQVYDTTGTNDSQALISDRCGWIKDGTYTVSVASQASGAPWLDSAPVSTAETVAVCGKNNMPTPACSMESTLDARSEQYVYSMTASEPGIYEIHLYGNNCGTGCGPFIFTSAGQTQNIPLPAETCRYTEFAVNKITYQQLNQNTYELDVYQQNSAPITDHQSVQVQPVSNVRLEMGADNILYVKYDLPQDTTGIWQYRIRLTDTDGMVFSSIGTGQSSAKISGACGRLSSGSYTVSVVSETRDAAYENSAPAVEAVPHAIFVTNLADTTPGVFSVNCARDDGAQWYTYYLTASSDGVYDLCPYGNALFDAWGPFNVSAAGESLMIRHGERNVYPSCQISKTVYEANQDGSFSMNIYQPVSVTVSSAQ